MKLSILICSLKSRDEQLNILLNSLFYQMTKCGKWYASGSTLNYGLFAYSFTDNSVEIIIYQDDKKITVVQKRNILIQQAKGEYITFIDDDDRVTDDYIKTLLQSIDKGYDSICFNVMYNPKGGIQKLVKYSCRMKDRELPTHYERATNHLMCTKRSIASNVKFKHVSFGEDSDWAKRLVRHIKTEGQINKVLYYYDFDHAKSETQ